MFPKVTLLVRFFKLFYGRFNEVSLYDCLITTSITYLLCLVFCVEKMSFFDISAL